MTRLDLYETVTIPSWLMKLGAAEHFQAHAMEHLHWMCLEVDSHRDLVRRGELFYERGTEKPQTPLEQARLHRRALLRGQRVFAHCPGIEEMDAPDTIHEVRLFPKSLLSMYIFNHIIESST